jgi:hypothetical protein
MFAGPAHTAIVKEVLNFPHGQICSSIIKVQHHCTSARKAYGKLEDPPIKHEYCVVFKKPAGEQADLLLQHRSAREQL